ncbi:MAG: GDP-mannose 4,6-dehydratase [Rhodospirillales bacterium]|nr:GDP-mannose 4,6-dehydratase [Rhodospirillales bacterium]
MTVLVTGTAGFIGYFTTLALLDAGRRVIGIDILNDYYDVSLKQARLDNLLGRNGFTFSQTDIAEREAVDAVFRENPDITEIIHLAAQPGVRYSLINPYAYTRSNIEGHLVLLEAARRLSGLKHFVYASSSSVYGDSSDVPFSTDKRTDTPVSLYAATKKSMEMMSHAYSHLYRMPLTGLRFFTVYGPWGRPDMAYYIFTKKILAGKPIPVFNNGEMRRDFTYIDDIVSGVVSCLGTPPADLGLPPYRLYNIGNNKTESLMDFISQIERALGKKAEIDFQPMQAGDVKETFADIDTMVEDFGFSPSTGIDVGIPRFVEWYKEFHGA